jgi:hypothetical protein
MTVVGTMVGVEFAVAVFVNPMLLRLAAGPSLEARADGARVLGRVMPFWYIGSLILTAGLAATWTADDHPGDWREQQQRWDRLHYVRVAIIVAAFVLTLIAATVA